MDSFWLPYMKHPSSTRFIMMRVAYEPGFLRLGTSWRSRSGRPSEAMVPFTDMLISVH